MRGKNFYRNGAFEPGITRAIDLTHAACTEGRLNFVRPKSCPEASAIAGRHYDMPA